MLGSCLEEAGELGVSVGDVLAAGALCQRSNHIPKRAEPLVDVHALRKLLPRCPSLLRPLTPFNHTTPAVTIYDTYKEAPYRRCGPVLM